MTQVATEAKVLSSVATMSKLSIEERRAKLEHIGQLLNEVLKKGEEKFALAKSTYDTVDRHCTRLDNDLQKIEDEQLIGPGRTNGGNGSQKKAALSNTTTPTTSTHASSSSAAAVAAGMATADKKRGHADTQKTGRGRKKSRNDADKEDLSQEDTYLSTEDAILHAKNAVSMSDLPIDPNEPKYCYCRQVSFGEMVACDNEVCEIEWFHLECVGLTIPPKGKWYCKNCISEFKKKKRI